MRPFDFWYRWLLAVSILGTAMGLVVACFSGSVLFVPHTAALAHTFFDGTLPEEAAALRAFLLGPLGGTIAGYFLLQAFIVWQPFRRKEPWAWQALLGALLLWFIVDSGVSIYHGAFFNVWMVNLWTLLLVGLPLGMTYRAFFGGTREEEAAPAPGTRPPDKRDG